MDSSPLALQWVICIDIISAWFLIGVEGQDISDEEWCGYDRKREGTEMIAIFLAPVYLLFCFYIWVRAIRWMGACHWLFQMKWTRVSMGIVYTLLVFSILIAFGSPASLFRTWVKRISNYWLGTLMYLILTIGVADLLRLICKRLRFQHKELLFSPAGHAAVGAVCFAVILVFTVTGIVTAHCIRTTDYEVSVEKDGGKLDELNVVLVADLHLGYNIGNWHMKQMVERINRQSPDIVLIAGDIFDNEYEALRNPEQLECTLSGIRSRYGVYACYGNHDIEEPVLAGFTFSKKGKKKESNPRMDEFVKKSGIQLLRDETVLIEDSFYLCGRADYERPGRGIDTRKTPEEITEDLNREKPILVLDHEPRELQELADAGADVDLCGHTHDGQMFPGNLLIHLFWENPCGYLKKNQMHNIVTSGIGVFGPDMRVGTKSEICNIRIHFQ